MAIRTGRYRGALCSEGPPPGDIYTELYSHGTDCKSRGLCWSGIGQEDPQGDRCETRFLAQLSSITTDVCSGIILETFLGGIVEIVLFMVLLHNNNASDNLIPVIRAAILGSILANLLLCLGACFFFGGIGRNEQDFDPAISEVGNGLLLVAGFGLLIPAAFFASLSGSVPELLLKEKVITISRVTSVILLVAFLMYGPKHAARMSQLMRIKAMCFSN